MSSIQEAWSWRTLTSDRPWTCAQFQTCVRARMRPLGIELMNSLCSPLRPSISSFWPNRCAFMRELIPSTLSLVTGPALEPLDLDQVTTHLRFTATPEDTLTHGS